MNALLMRIWLVTSFGTLIGVFGCEENDNNPSGDTDDGADSQTLDPTDTETTFGSDEGDPEDSEIESDTASETEEESGTETDTPAETDSDTQSVRDSDTATLEEPDTETVADTEDPTATETEVDTGFDSESETEPTLHCDEGTLQTGDFCIRYDDSATGVGTLFITHTSEPSRVVFDTVQNKPFINVGVGDETVTSNRASFEIEDKILKRCTEQTVDSISLQEDESVLLSGGFDDCDAGYRVIFDEVEDDHLQFDIQLVQGDQKSQKFNRIFLIHGSTSEEKFFGFGQQYSFFDLKGKKLPIWTQEQGHGRGLQPLTWALNTFGDGAAGYWDTTYTSVPYYVSSRSRSLFLEQYEYSEFDMTEDAQVTIKIFSPGLTGRILNGANPLEIVENYTSYTGRMDPLPDWTQEGAIVRAYKGSKEVEDFVDMLLDAEVPLAGLWVEDWMGRRQNFTGTRLWWNWQLDKTIYPDWPDFISRLHEKDIRVTTYFNPYLTDAWSNINHERNLYREAKDKGYFVTLPGGNIFTFGSGGFEGAIVDLTNPAARTWYKSFMIEQLELGVSGWMADFGEAIPYQGVLHSGADTRVYHNQFPAEWAKLNREAIQEAGREGDAVFWTRSGNALSPKYTTLAWLGDQSVTWDSFDGIKTAVIGLLSAGLSGYSLIHGDIGGYLSVDYAVYKITRTKELLYRWIELGAFQSVFRTHDTLRPERNPQFYSDEESLVHFGRFAKVFAGLAPYREQLMAVAKEKGLPLVRPLFMHYPGDPVAWDLTYQFMFGPDFLVAPVLDPDTDLLSVYLPAGKWIHLWTKAEYGNEDYGVWVDVDAPIGSPPVFFKQGSEAGESLSNYLIR